MVQLLGVLAFLFGVLIGVGLIDQKLRYGWSYVNSKAPGPWSVALILLGGACLVRLGRRKPHSSEASAMPSEGTADEQAPEADRGDAGSDGTPDTDLTRTA